MARQKSNTSTAKSAAVLGFEAKFWLTADKPRNEKAFLRCPCCERICGDRNGR